jgi:hypothetical protein
VNRRPPRGHASCCTLAHAYRITTIDPVDGMPCEWYVAGVESREAIPLWQVARRVEEQFGEHGMLVGIEDLVAEALVLDVTDAGRSGQECTPRIGAYSPAPASERRSS